MNLKLEKPIVFFDLETTGLNVVNDRIVEIALLKVMPDGSEQIKTYLINPQMLIPQEATEVHGITNTKVKDAPIFSEVASEIVAFLEGCDLAGYNSNKFDIPLLVEELLRAGIDFDMRDRKCIDVQTIFYRMEPRTLVAALKYYCGKSLENAHAAEADTRATYEVLKGQVAMYEGTSFEDKKTKEVHQFENTIDTFSQLSQDNIFVDMVGVVVLNNQDQEIFNIGKHKGIPVKTVFTKEPAYYDWMMRSNFALSTKKVITRIYNEVKFEKMMEK